MTETTTATGWHAHLRLEVQPVAKARARVTRQGHAYTPSATRRAEDDLVLLAQAQRPSAPLEGPVRVRLVVVLPVPRSWAAWEREAAEAGHLLPTGRPDLDNYEKLLADALTRGGWWRDDSQIVQVDSMKRYARCDERPGWDVYVEELPYPRNAAEWRERSRSCAGGRR